MRGNSAGPKARRWLLKAMKEVGGQVYAHVCAVPEFEEPLQSLIAKAAAIASAHAGSDFNVVKVDRSGNVVSLLSYPDFFGSAFPALHRSWTVDLRIGRVSRRTYEDSLNPPILHRKELLLPMMHEAREKFARLTSEVEALGLFENPIAIGFREAWEDRLSARGYRVADHALVPLGNNVFGGEAVRAGNANFEIYRHRTALVRTGLSAPVQALLRYGLLKPGGTLFDYGCGRGDDIRALRALDISAAGWDPYFAPSEACGAADFVNIGFVVNVIEDFAERVAALQRAYSFAGKALSVAAMLSTAGDSLGRPYRDGYISSRNTFQKYFSQAELAGFIAQVLEEEPVPVSPGVFIVFRDKALEEEFLANRDRNSGLIVRLRKLEQQKVERSPRRDRNDLKYQAHAQDLEELWEVWLSLGRPPEEDEVPNADALSAAFGSLKRALRFLGRHKDPQLTERAANARREDLLVHFALQQFRRKPRYRQLELRLQRDIKALFGDYASAQDEARRLLLAARSPERIHEECIAAAERGLGWLEEGRSLQLQTALVERLSPLLRIYVGCASLLYGDVKSADLLKIHIRTGKLSLMRFDAFNESPLPRMIERVKVNLRSQEVDVFQYRDGFEPPYLYRKSRFLDEESLRYGDQVAFEEQLEEAGLLSFSGYGPSATEFDRELAKRRFAIDEFRLIRSQSIPNLDDPCGERFTYRDLIECGETQRRTGQSNVPKDPETYNALYDLAANILDPVIEYFGAIELTYGFSSPELTREISGRVAPKIDQHAAHERSKRGMHICSRLGAAVDFLVRDEDMLEVAQWIAANLPFDRLYFYGHDRPIHVSYGPDQSREFVEMRLTPAGRHIPYIHRS